MSSDGAANGRQDGPLCALDVHLGSRLQLRRSLTGWTLEQLATALDLPTTQLKACESGRMRLDPVRLCEAARLLNVHVGFFYDDAATVQPYGVLHYQPAPTSTAPRAPVPSEAIRLIEAFKRLDRVIGRHSIVEFIDSLVDVEQSLAAYAVPPPSHLAGRASP